MSGAVKDYLHERARSLAGIPSLELTLDALQQAITELDHAVERAMTRSERFVLSADLRFESQDAAFTERINDLSAQLEALAESLNRSSLLEEKMSAAQSLVSELTKAVESSGRHVAGISARLDDVRARLAAALGDRAENAIPFWYEWSFWEPSVQLALRDLCRPGDTVFDVGANMAALSVLMSRLVGPRGMVCAFEASQRIVEKAQYNLVQNGCANVQLFHRAVYHCSGERLPIFQGTHLNDSIFPLEAEQPKSSSLSLALDDFVAHWNAEPTLIKMDIEGAEYDALMGSSDLIRRLRPHLILEQQLDDPRCTEWLISQGYVALDLADYRFLSSVSDIRSGTLVNVLFIHQSRIAGTPFADLGKPLLIKQFASDELVFDLDPGRYVAEALIEGDGTDNSMMAGVEINGVSVTRYQTHTKFLAESYRFLPFHVDDSGRVEVFFRFQSRSVDPTFKLDGVRLWKVPGTFPRRLSLA